MFKVLAVLGFVAVASAADLTVGAQDGKLILEKNVFANPALWRQDLNVTINSTNPEEVIAGIVVIDNRPEKDGEATVVEGGEGEKNVTIELKSPTVLRGFDFTIKVFAREETENAQSTNQSTPIGVDTHNPQEPNTGGDIIIGAQPTAASSTEASKDDQVQINPALVGTDQVRQKRETEFGVLAIEQVSGDITKVADDAAKEIDENVKTAFSVFGGDDVVEVIRQTRNTDDQETEDQTSDDATKDADKPEQLDVDETDSQQEPDDSDDNENAQSPDQPAPIGVDTQNQPDDSEQVLPVEPEGEAEVDGGEDVEENRQGRHAYYHKEEETTTEEVTTEDKEDHHYGHYHHGYHY